MEFSRSRFSKKKIEQIFVSFVCETERGKEKKLYNNGVREQTKKKDVSFFLFEMAYKFFFSVLYNFDNYKCIDFIYFSSFSLLFILCSTFFSFN
jgi:hypothetical protein